MILRKHFHFFMLVLSGKFSEKLPVQEEKSLSENVSKRNHTYSKKIKRT